MYSKVIMYFLEPSKALKEAVTKYLFVSNIFIYLHHLHPHCPPSLLIF